MKLQKQSVHPSVAIFVSNFIRGGYFGLALSVRPSVVSYSVGGGSFGITVSIRKVHKFYFSSEDPSVHPYVVKPVSYFIGGWYFGMKVSACPSLYCKVHK